jgi:hypothetical protein
MKMRLECGFQPRNTSTLQEALMSEKHPTKIQLENRARLAAWVQERKKIRENYPGSEVEEHPGFFTAPTYPGLAVSTCGVVIRFDTKSRSWLKARQRVVQGYPTVYCRYITFGNKYANVLGVHRIVADAFLGPQEPGMVVRHKDDNRRNCMLSNICYGEQYDNMQDKIANNKTSRGEKHPKAKLTEAQAIEIIVLSRHGVKDKVIAEYIRKISYVHVYQITNHLSWKHLHSTKLFGNEAEIMLKFSKWVCGTLVH